MNRTPFLRVLWKEYRAQRALWWSMVGITLFFQLWVLGLVTSEVERVKLLFGVSLIWPALYSMGCGALLFAAEHDEGTFEFQRCLPVTAGQLLSGKLIFAVASLAAMLVLTVLLGCGLAGGRLPEWRTSGALLGVCGVAALELLAWSVFFSLLSRRVLPAAILGAVAASLSVHLCVNVLYQASPDRFTGIQWYVYALPPRLGILLLVVLADLWLGRRWLRRGSESPFDATASEGECPRLERIARWKAARRGSGFVHLLWQHWRQSWRLMATMAAGAGLLAVWMGDIWRGPPGGYTRSEWTNLALPAVMILAALMGVGVFMPDQRHSSFRFLAERGLRPTMVWLSRQLVWGLPALLVLTASGGAVLSVLGDAFPHAPSVPPWTLFGVREEVWRYGVVLGMCYAAGQFCSMLLRSSILAAFLGLFLAGLLGFWSMIMAALEVPWSLAVLPIPVLLLLVTWLRTGDWLRERNSRRAWLKSGGVLGLGLVPIVAAVATYRVHEIPRVEPGFDVAEFTRPLTAAEKETLSLYQAAFRKIVGPPSTETSQEAGDASPEERQCSHLAAWVAANQVAIDLALQASQRSKANFFGISGSSELIGLETPGELVVKSGQVLEATGKPQEAAERYLAALRISWQLQQRTTNFNGNWLETQVYQHLIGLARSKKLSAEALAQFIPRLQKTFEETPSSADPIKLEYLGMRQGIFSDREPYYATERYFVLWRWLVHRFAPWESARAVRVANFVSAQALQEQRNVEQALAMNQPTPWAESLMDRLEQQRLGRTTPLLWDTGWYNATAAATTANYLKTQVRRRIVLLYLALAAWQAEHGELPPTLETLVGPYLDQLPLDPYTGKPFRYCREGLAYPLTVREYPHQAWDANLGTLAPCAHDRSRNVVPARTPLLWSPGPPARDKNGQLVGPNTGPTPDPAAEADRDTWQHGFGFVLP